MKKARTRRALKVNARGSRPDRKGAPAGLRAHVVRVTLRGVKRYVQIRWIAASSRCGWMMQFWMRTLRAPDGILMEP